MNVSSLLAQPHLSVIARDAGPELLRIGARIEHKALVDGRDELEELFGQLLGQLRDARLPPAPKTLDLIGPATPELALLALGRWVIDVSRPAVRAFFRELADLAVLPRLGVRAVRLLGCETARTRQGRAAICKLSEILELEVLGTSEPLVAAHYDARGLRDDAHHLLVSSAELAWSAGPAAAPAALPPLDLGVGVGAGADPAPRAPRLLDIDALPASQLGAHRWPWPRRLASGRAARDLLVLVRRAAGAVPPGPPAPPSWELVLPAARPGWYHLLEVLPGAALVRAYPDGEHRPGVVYSVNDPAALAALVGRLPPAPDAGA
ncbi:MAG TPA: hypothetical protein VNO30_02975 [Kofleriaceae bacterium]|nr:hypothetical protein [Kofleriaceae bacterium]